LYTPDLRDADGESKENAVGREKEVVVTLRVTMVPHAERADYTSSPIP
jgi:hypothetical protein